MAFGPAELEVFHTPGPNLQSGFCSIRTKSLSCLIGFLCFLPRLLSDESSLTSDPLLPITGVIFLLPGLTLFYDLYRRIFADLSWREPIDATLSPVA
jgi:hypothetical protein